MRKYLFVLSQIFSIIIEYLFLFVLFYYIFKIGIIISISIVGALLVTGLILTLLANHTINHDTTEEKEEKKYYDECMEVVNKGKTLYKGLKTNLIYLSISGQGVAFSAGKNIYINNSMIRGFNIDYIKGIVAHEVGHEISGLCRLSFLSTMKMSTIISKMLMLVFNGLYLTHKKFLLPICYLLVGLIVLFSLNNIVFTYPFLINDEYYANKMAISLGYGEGLRCYYGLVCEDSTDKLLVFLDFTHPRISKMLDKTNKDLGISEDLTNCYYVGDSLYRYFTPYKTLVIPEFIKVLKHNSVVGEKLLKVTGKGVERIDGTPFINSRQIEKLVFPNLKNLTNHHLKGLHKIKDIIINDDNVLLNFINEDKIIKAPFKLKIYNRLVKKGLIDLNNNQNETQNNI